MSEGVLCGLLSFVYDADEKKYVYDGFLRSTIKASVATWIHGEIFLGPSGKRMFVMVDYVPDSDCVVYKGQAYEI